MVIVASPPIHGRAVVLPIIHYLPRYINGALSFITLLTFMFFKVPKRLLSSSFCSIIVRSIYQIKRVADNVC